MRVLKKFLSAGGTRSLLLLTGLLLCQALPAQAGMVVVPAGGVHDGLLSQ